MSRPSKARIRQSFERAASTYNSAAEIQRHICHQLIAGLPKNQPIQQMMDAGCGTGFALPLLQQQFPDALSLGLDLSHGMLQQISIPCCRLSGDIEQLPLADNCIDLYWSSLSIQWCDLSQALAEAHRVLRPQGKLALATLGANTFKELRQAFSQVDSYRHTLAFHTPDDIQRMAITTGFSAVDVQNRPEIVYYPDFRTLLKAVKAIGANQLGDGRRTSLMSRSAFSQAESAFETWRTQQGLPLSYDVIYLYGST